MSKVEVVQFDYAHTLYLYYIPEVYHHCTLDNFDFSGQKRLVSIIKNFLDGTDKNGLYLHGSFGVGKSHLLVSLYRVIVSREEDSSPATVYYVSFENAIRDLGVKERDYNQEYLEMLCECSWLFLDDLSVLAPLKDRSVEILRTIINTRYENKLPTCFAANLDPASLEGLHPHAVSRIRGMCEIVKVVGRDRRR